MIVELFFSCLVCLFLPHNLFAYIQLNETPVINYLKPVDVLNNKSNVENVDCIFVINLDRRLERWNRVENLFQEYELKVNRFSAVDGWLLTDADVKILEGDYDRHLAKGRIGCLLSHVSILKEAYARGYNVIWVMEDDVEFVDDIQLIPPLLSRLYEIDPDWDVFYTDIDGKNTSNGDYILSLSSDFRPDDFFHHPLSYYLKREIVGDGIMRIGQRFCTHSLLFSKKGIEKILHYFTHVYLYSAIDIDMHYIPGIRQYSVVKDIVSVNPAPSDTYFFQP